MHWDIIHTSSLEFKQIFSFPIICKEIQRIHTILLPSFYIKKKNNLRKTKTLILQLWREAKEGGKNFPWNEKERKRKRVYGKEFPQDRIKISNGRLSKMAFRSFIRLEGLIRELLDDEPRDVPFKVSGIRLSKKKPRGIKWRCSFLLSLSRSPSCIFQS